ncbi:hypothetical protein [Clostridium aminobutyricum]|uniref:Uncharacterized protein n=1 Tax=Clostridium aminobutyricum TaxID=33953 RepID=A0A939D690_CLOAM|nr:hypothetical protein [Clostridium aminobutyricum]MBN7771815.1 hypothetical protein [Clostridium aminobutyricum]
MKLKKNSGAKSKISILLYVVAAIVAVFGIAMLSVNIYIFKSTISQYVAQGYPAELVMQSLIPSQLLPGIFEPIALYGGLAFVLIGVGVANSKIAAHFASVTAEEFNTFDADEIPVLESDEYGTEYADAIEPIESEEEAQDIADLEDSEITDAEETKNA